MLRLADGRVLNPPGLGHRPARIPPDYFVREHGGRLPHAVHCTVVPAAPATWIRVLSDHGTLSFADVAGEATRFAHEGSRSTSTSRRGDRVPGRVLSLGVEPAHLPAARFVQPDLATRSRRSSRPSGAPAAPASTGCGRRTTRSTGDIAHRIVGFSASTAGSSSSTTSPGSRRSTRRQSRPAGGTSRCTRAGHGAKGRCSPRRSGCSTRSGSTGSTARARSTCTSCSKCSRRRSPTGSSATRIRRTGFDVWELLGDDHIRRRIAHIRRDRTHPDLPEPIGAQPDIIELLRRRAPGATRDARRTPRTSASSTARERVLGDPVGRRVRGAGRARHGDRAVDARRAVPVGPAASRRRRARQAAPAHPEPRLRDARRRGVRGVRCTWGRHTGPGNAPGDSQRLPLRDKGAAAIDAPRFSTWNFPNSFSPFEFLRNRWHSRTASIPRCRRRPARSATTCDSGRRSRRRST